MTLRHDIILRPFMAILAAACCSCLSNANAATVLTNLGQSGAGAFGVGKISGFTYYQAQGFKTGDSPGYNVDSVTIDVQSVVGSPGSFFLELFDDGGAAPGSLLGSFAVGSNPTAGLNTYSFSDDSVVLSDNTRYFVVARAPSAANGGRYNWKINNSSVADASSDPEWSNHLHYQSSNSGTSWISLAGTHRFSLDATPVPEPSTLVLLGMGVMGLLAYAWRRRRV